MFEYEGKWIDVEKHRANVRVSNGFSVPYQEIGVVVFQYNNATKAHRAVAKSQAANSTIIDADVAEAILNITVKWPV